MTPTPFLFLRPAEAALMKATMKKMVMVPGYTRRDGTVVPPHQKSVHYNPDALFSDVAAGKGSHSQKKAHAKLAPKDWWQKLGADEKALAVMSLATDLQDAASASAVVSGWKKVALLGKNPTASQWAAFYALPAEKKAALFDEVQSKAGLAHLSPPALDVPADKAEEPEQAAQAADLPSAPPAIPAEHLEAQAKLAAMESGPHYQKVALAALKNDEAWQKLSPPEKHAAAMAQYQKLQSAASASAAVSVAKKAMLAGKVPSKAQYLALMQADDAVVAKVAVAVGQPKYGALMGAAQAKYGNAVGAAPVAVPAVDAATAAAPVQQTPAPTPAVTPQPTTSPPSQIGVKAPVYYNTSPGHSKQWSVSQHGTSVVTQWGKIGGGQQGSTKVFGTPGAAAAYVQTITKQKLANGYQPTALTATHQHADNEWGGVPVPSASPAAQTVPALVKKLTATQVAGAPNPLCTTAANAAINGNVELVAAKYLKAKKAESKKYISGLLAKMGYDLNGNPSASLGGDAKQSPGGLPPALEEKLASLYYGTVQTASGTLLANQGESVPLKWPKKSPAKLKAEILQSSGIPAKAIQTDTGYVVELSAPKDGDTKQGSEGLLIFKDGRWHKVVAADEHGEVPPVLVPVADPPLQVSASKAKPAPKVAKVTAASIPAGPHGVPVFPMAHSGSMDGWKQVGKQQGSNPGGKFRDPHGQVWYVKFPSNESIVRNELLAAKFYEMLGVSGQKAVQVRDGDKVGIASRWVDCTKTTPEKLKATPGAVENFPIDAWLANWDVVGMGYDNLLVGADGKAVRIDAGGSLLYRAQGEPKGAAFSSDVSELETLTDPKKNSQTAAVFAGAKKQDFLPALGKLALLKPSQIGEMVALYGPKEPKLKAELVDKLTARRAFILKKYGIDDPHNKPPVDESSSLA